MKFSPVFDDSYSRNFTPEQGSVAIYALLDDDDTIRYVGKTIHCVGVRAHDHWLGATAVKSHYNRKELWLRTRQTPPRVTLMGVCGADEWQALETAWITDLRLVDNDLTNTAPGGFGHGGGWTHTEETKERIGRNFRGKKRDRAAVEKTAAAHRGRKRPAETGRRISEAKKGKPWNATQRAARDEMLVGEVSCLCGNGPFKGAWGLLQHRRQKHDM